MEAFIENKAIHQEMNQCAEHLLMAVADYQVKEEEAIEHLSNILNAYGVELTEEEVLIFEPMNLTNSPAILHK